MAGRGPLLGPVAILSGPQPRQVVSRVSSVTGPLARRQVRQVRAFSHIAALPPRCTPPSPHCLSKITQNMKRDSSGQVCNEGSVMGGESVMRGL